MKKIEEILSSGTLPSFYLVNAAGWFFFIALDSIILTIWMDGLSHSFLAYLSNSLQWSTGFLITTLLRHLYKKVYLRKFDLLKIISVIIVCSLSAAIFLYIFSHIISFLFTPEQLKESFWAALSLRNIIFRMTQLFPIMAAWSVLYFGIKFWFDISLEREKAQKSDFLAQSAQLQMLRYQINPHFLFNSFSSLRALIRSNPKAAAEMVSKLSEFYRYSLITKSSSEVALNEEIEAIKSYAEIEKIRFDENIEFDFAVDAGAVDFPVPSFIIHPLFENAIKYGMKTSKLPLKIKLEATVKNKTLVVAISNSGKWVTPTINPNESGTNTGLENIKNRLQLAYPGRHKFDIADENGYVIVTLEISMEPK